MKWSVAFACLFSTVAFFGSSFAAEEGASTPPKEPQPGKLNEVVITATRTEKTAFDLPGSTGTINSEDILHGRMPRTVPEALREEPGIMVQKTGHGQGSPFIRGFTGFRTLFLIDGIRLNNSVFRDGPNQYWNTVDALSIDRMEIVKGPGSVLYGSDAIGGTVNALTRGPDNFTEQFSWKGRLYGRFASAEDSASLRAEVQGSVENRFGFLFGTSYKNFGDLEAGRGTGHLPHTGYDDWDGDIKLIYMPTAASRLTFAHYKICQDDAWRTHKTIYAKSWKGTTVGNELERSLDQNRELTYLQYEAWDLDSFADRMKASFSYHTQEEKRFRIKSDGSRERQGFEVNTPGAWVQFESPTDFGTFTCGAEAYRDYVDSFTHKYNADGSFNKAEIQGPVADDATYDLLGLFVQHDMPVTDSLEAILGIRYTYASVDADKVKNPTTGALMSISDTWDTVVGSGRLLYHLDDEDHYNLFGGVSQGFRAPNLSDLTRLDTARSNEIETAAPGLDPEKFVSYELGAKASYDNWSAQAAYFYTDIRDMIVRTPTGNIIGGDSEVTKKNAADGYVQGVELGTSWRFRPQFTVFGNAAWMDGEVETYPTSAPTTAKEPIDRLMPPIGHVGLRWDHPGERFWAEALCTISGSQGRLSTRDKSDTQRIPPGGTPGYTVFTIRGGWKLSEHTTLAVAVENITDEDYRIHGSGQNEPGRNFILSLDQAF